MKTITIALFALTYVLLLLFPNKRAYIALASAATFIFTGILPVSKVCTAIDWNVLLMIIGTMGIVSLFIESKMPAFLADLIIEKMPDIKWSVISLALFAGIISAFVDNVATVLMVVPVALNIAKKLKISPVPGVIAIAISSNLQGAATLVGDTTSILLGGYANLNFFDFFLVDGKPGMFWVVQAGALASLFVLLYLFRKHKVPVSTTERTTVHDFFPSILLVGMVVLLIAASFMPNMPYTINGIICISLMGIGLIKSFFKTRDVQGIFRTLKEIDMFTILLLTGLFIVIGGITEAGIVKDISHIFIRLSNDNLFIIYSLIVWASVLLSAFIDNIPYVATMLPVTASIASIMGIEPHILYFGLLSGATLGGNLTPIGASANITALCILRKDGHEVSAWEFMRMGIPFTLSAVTVGYLMIWLIWA